MVSNNLVIIYSFDMKATFFCMPIHKDASKCLILKNLFEVHLSNFKSPLWDLRAFTKHVMTYHGNPTTSKTNILYVDIKEVLLAKSGTLSISLGRN